MILPGEQRFPFQHLRENTASAPDVHLHVILLPRKHDLGRPVIPRRNIASHLRVLDTSQAKVTDFEIAILIDQDVAWLEVAVYYTSGMDVFQPALHRSVFVLLDLPLSWVLAYQDLIEEVLDELLFQRSRGQKAVKVSTQELSDEVATTVSFA